MPELPEVETTRRGVAPLLEGRHIHTVRVREPRLRWPVPAELPEILAGQAVRTVTRRAKYLLVGLDSGTLILHLGMSGSLRVVADSEPPGFHDHVDLVLDDGRALRLRDPRRFGAVLWTTEAPDNHPLLRHLGPEPFDEAFTGDYLYTASRGRRVAVKHFLMDGRIVVGVGNIYANEALFQAGIDPRRAAGRIARARYTDLAAAVRRVLGAAIEAGGTTLRDFQSTEGRPGYFRQQLAVYGREGRPCPRCARLLHSMRLGQRATVYCGHCQR